MPMVELIEQSQIAVDELLENLGRATLEAALLISAASTLLETEKSFRKIMGFKDYRPTDQRGMRTTSC